MEKPTGIWIAFEGNDGCGKTTQVKKFVTFLRKSGLDVVETREPGGSKLAEKSRPLIFDPTIKDDPMAQLYQFVFARRVNIMQTVLPAFADKKIVVSDRSEGSTIAYQHFQYGLPWELVREVNDTGTEGVKPLLTVLLDVAEAVAMQRKSNHGLERNYYDEANIEEWRKRSKGYIKLAKNYRQYDRKLWVVVDANGSVEEVFENIIQSVRKTKVLNI